MRRSSVDWDFVILVVASFAFFIVVTVWGGEEKCLDPNSEQVQPMRNVE